MPGEFTVFDDGTVVSPEPSAIARPETAPEAGTVATGETPRSPTAVPEKREEEELSTRPDKSTGPLSQMAYALPYGLGAGVLVAGLWLLIALFSDQWTQVSVFSLGVVVPWALFNSTTRKKRLGRRVWTETPPVWMISAMSFAIVAVFTPLLELMAYNVLYGSNPSKLPFSDFVQRYMKGADWFMVSCGLVLALLVPFLLKLGVEWSKPSFRKASGEPPPLAEDEQVEANADDPGEEPTPRSLPGEDESDAENEDNPDDPQ